MKGSKIDKACRIGIRWVGIALFALLLLSLDWPRIFNLMEDVKLGWLLLAGAFNLLFVLTKAVRWHSILRVQHISYNFWRAIRVYQAGTFFALITPGRVGEVVKISFLKRELGIQHRIGLANVIMDRLLDLFTLSFTAIVFVLWHNAPAEFLWPVILFCLTSVALTLAIFARKSVHGLLSLLNTIPIVKNLLSSRIAAIEDLRKELVGLWRPLLIVPVLYSFAAYLLVYAGSYFLSVAQGIQITPMQCAYCIAVTNVVALIPVTISGIGTRDLSMVYLFSSFGLLREQAVFFSFGYLIVSLLFASAPGAVFWFLESSVSGKDLVTVSDGEGAE